MYISHDVVFDDFSFRFAHITSKSDYSVSQLDNGLSSAVIPLLPTSTSSLIPSTSVVSNQSDDMINPTPITVLACTNEVPTETSSLNVIALEPAPCSRSHPMQIRF